MGRILETFAVPESVDDDDKNVFDDRFRTALVYEVDEGTLCRRLPGTGTTVAAPCRSASVSDRKSFEKCSGAVSIDDIDMIPFEPGQRRSPLTLYRNVLAEKVDVLDIRPGSDDDGVAVDGGIDRILNRRIPVRYVDGGGKSDVRCEQDGQDDSQLPHETPPEGTRDEQNPYQVYVIL